jgi:nitrate/nitrite transport system substrate-binding protein
MASFKSASRHSGSVHPSGCGCSLHSALDQGDGSGTPPPATDDGAIKRRVETTIISALFPNPVSRRQLLSTIGLSAAVAAISQFFPLEVAAEAFAADETPEKDNLRIGFVPITCASPIIMAQPAGIYGKHRLNVEVVKTSGWAAIREKAVRRDYDAAHMLSPMPIASTLGLGAPPVPYVMPAVENVNGQAITLAVKHKNNRDPKGWKGFKLAVPYEYSMHNYLLRYYLADHGIDPETDVEIAAVPPPQMVMALRAGAIDGYLAPDPANQRAVYEGVGFIHLLSKEIWDRHPCCAFAVSRDFVTELPKTYSALLKAIIEATAFASKPENRKATAGVLALPRYLNQPSTVVEQVLTGTFEDGLGNVRTVPDRIDFDPFPWESFAIWIMTQMKRWGQLQDGVTYAEIAKQVFLATDASRLMTEAGITPPTGTSKKFKVMGKTFDPAKPEEYLASFKIKKAIG